MNPVTFSMVCVCVLGSFLVASTPVYPALPLKYFSPVDICLFICNICFDEMLLKIEIVVEKGEDAGHADFHLFRQHLQNGPEMMDCANHVCLAKEQFEMNLGLLKVGRTCKNFNKLDSFVMGNDSE